MAYDLTTLNRLSIPGVNRPLGIGDLVPYLGTQNANGGAASDIGTARPGVVGSFGPSGSIYGNNSALANLSALTPILNALYQANQQAAIPSGQGNAQAQPQAQAASGPASSVFGVAPIAGSNSLLTPSGSPAAAPSPLAPPTGGASTGDTSASAPGTADAGAPGAPGEADAGPGINAADAAASGGLTGVGDVSSGDAGAGGAAGDGGAGGTVLVTYALKHNPLNARRAMAYWTRVRRMFLKRADGKARYQHYLRMGARLIEQIEALPADERDRIRYELHAALVAPIRRAARPEDVERSVSFLAELCTALVYTLGLDVERIAA